MYQWHVVLIDRCAVVQYVSVDSAAAAVNATEDIYLHHRSLSVCDTSKTSLKARLALALQLTIGFS